jgi:ATP-dependent DNA ligase
MSTVIDILEALESDNSRLFKEETLERHSKNDLLRRVFTTVGDPYINFFVSKFRAPVPVEHHEDDDFVIENFLSMLVDELSTRQLTGNAAKGAVEQFFMTLDHRQAKWCTRILLKNLRCGVQSTTVNKVWPGSIVGFSVQLAETLESTFEKGKGIVVTQDLQYPVRVEPKLDGLRCIAVKHNGEVTMFTRNGTVLETLPTIKAALVAADYDDFVLDGEAMGSDWNESASVVMSRKKGKDDSGMVYNVFDAMHFDDWRDQANDMSLFDRIDVVSEIVAKVASKHVTQVIGKTVAAQSALLDFYASTMENGYEGIMVKNLSASYCFKRTDAVMKLKPVTTYEGVVVGHYEGRRGSKREGLWGGFEVLMPNGVVTRVGGGFTDKLKSEIGMDPDSWIGRIVELEGQPDPLTADGLTVDGRVRFPVFIRERDPSDVDQRVIAAGAARLGT